MEFFIDAMWQRSKDMAHIWFRSELFASILSVLSTWEQIKYTVYDHITWSVSQKSYKYFAWFSALHGSKNWIRFVKWSHFKWIIYLGICEHILFNECVTLHTRKYDTRKWTINNLLIENIVCPFIFNQNGLSLFVSTLYVI